MTGRGFRPAMWKRNSIDSGLAVQDSFGDAGLSYTSLAVADASRFSGAGADARKLCGLLDVSVTRVIFLYRQYEGGSNRAVLEAP